MTSNRVFDGSANAPLICGLALGIACAACSNRSGKDELRALGANSQAASGIDATSPSTKSIGDSCSRQDGWQPMAFRGPQPNEDHDKPYGVKPQANYVDYHDLPNGIAYCLAPGGQYPDGYFTANCGSDADCPLPGVCLEGLCVASCSTDADCRAPSTCGGSGKVKYCRHLEMQED
jgi:hypothetical protein